MTNTAILIPARMGSTRLPNKPLADINGITMINHVCNRAASSGIKDVYVACSELEVKQEVEKAGFQAIMTDPELPSGTDRIAAALRGIGKEYDYIVNLQ